MVAFLLYAVFLARFLGAYAGGSDSSGYLNNARLLAHGRLTAPMRLLPGLAPESLPSYTHVPLGFIPNADHVTLTPTYPMGLPLLIMVGAKIVGWALAPGLVMGLQALFGAWLMYRVGREAGLESGWAWLGVLLLVTGPLYVFMSVQLMSDTPATVWSTAAVLWAWQSRKQVWLALAAGAAVALAVLVRPSDMLVFVPVGLALGWSLRRWVFLGLGGLPGAIFQGMINHAAYGKIFKTGYGDVGAVFGLHFIPGTLVHYAIWLPVVLSPLCLLAFGLPALRRREGMSTAVLAVWGVIFPLFYVVYACTQDDWWYLRYLLPSFPPLIVSSLLVLRALVAKCKLTPRAAWFAPAAAVILIYCVGATRHLHAYSSGLGEQVYPETAAWVRTNLPSNAVVLSMQTSGALLFYTELTIVRWDQLSPAEFQRIAAACAQAARPLFAVLYPFEIDEWHIFQEHAPGPWVQTHAVRHVTIWRYDAPAASR